MANPGYLSCVLKRALTILRSFSDIYGWYVLSVESACRGWCRRTDVRRQRKRSFKVREM